MWGTGRAASAVWMTHLDGFCLFNPNITRLLLVSFAPRCVTFSLPPLHLSHSLFLQLLLPVSFLHRWWRRTGEKRSIPLSTTSNAYVHTMIIVPGQTHVYSAYTCAHPHTHTDALSHSQTAHTYARKHKHTHSHRHTHIHTRTHISTHALHTQTHSLHVLTPAPVGRPHAPGSSQRNARAPVLEPTIPVTSVKNDATLRECMCAASAGVRNKARQQEIKSQGEGEGEM